MRFVICLLVICSIFSCRDDRKIPDVSAIKVELKTRRFEKDLFSIDQHDFNNQLSLLLAKYPSFSGNFMSAILTVDPNWPIDTVSSYVKAFVASYKPVFDTSEIVFADFKPYENEIKTGLQFVKYYFPEYKAPQNIITYIGPMDGFGDILSDDAFLIGLHTHLGKNYSAYASTWVQETYPAYLTNRFEPSYISINCMKNIINDMYPEKNEDKTMIIQMIEKGKRLYLLSSLLPLKEEFKLIGYTEEQLKDCYKHESQIWDLFIQNDLLQTNDINVIKNYVAEGPKTQELGEGAPGNIGSFTGWQIVKKYMNKNPGTTLTQLMKTEAETIFTQTRYKP